jgi:hypothetical protein
MATLEVFCRFRHFETLWLVLQSLGLCRVLSVAGEEGGISTVVIFAVIYSSILNIVKENI